MLPDAPILLYRGHFECDVGLDHTDSLLTAQFGGGLEESEVLFPKMRTASLSYPTLHRDAMIEIEEDVFVNRLEYITGFYNARMEAGNEPFLMKFPLDSQWYLFRFTQTELNVRLIDLFMGSSGLQLKECRVRGLVPDNADGSFDED
jgi:hypothetical protein